MKDLVPTNAATAFWSGVALILAANVLLPLQDALSKGLVSVVPVWELLFVRSLTVLAVALAIGRRALVGRALATPLKGRMVLRSLVILAGWVAFCEAIRELPLAQATTIYFASPILVTLAAGPLLGERIGPRQWGAVALGFSGVCLASGLAGFELSAAASLALFSTVCWAVALLMLRAMSAEEGTLVQLVFANGVFVLATAPFLVLLSDTGLPDPRLIVSMMVVGIVGGAGQFALYEAARRLPASVLSALEYSAILTAFVLGYAMFGERPTPTVFLGAALVLLSGLATVAIGHRRTRADGAADGRRPPDDLAGPSRGAPRQASSQPKETGMSDDIHDLVVTTIARTRFPFPGQTTWAADYVTLTNVPERRRSIPVAGREHYPDIVIEDGTGRIREIGEVEMRVEAASLAYLKAGSLTADDDTAAKVRHFFLYVPAGLEPEAKALLDENEVSYAGVRGFTVHEDGTVTIVPFVTPGDTYDHQITDPKAV